MQNFRQILEETLLALGGTKKKNSIQFIDAGLSIMNKDSGVKYTVSSVELQDEPIVKAYRYNLDNNQKIEIDIHKKDFKNYVPA